MKRFKFVLCLLVLTFTCASPALAEKSVELDKTVVTATRTETPIENLPVSVTVITKDDIEKMHAKTVDDVLNKAAGVQIKRRAGLSACSPGVYVRGTGDASRVMVLKDGIPLNAPYLGTVGGEVWGAMSGENIEKVEIVRGASSALYGSSAMSGVINIITKPAKKKITGGASFEGGTFDTYIGNAQFSGATDKFGLRVAAGHKRSDGYEHYIEWKDYYETERNKCNNVSVGGDVWLGLSAGYEKFWIGSLGRLGKDARLQSQRAKGPEENGRQNFIYS